MKKLLIIRIIYKYRFCCVKKRKGEHSYFYSKLLYSAYVWFWFSIPCVCKNGVNVNMPAFLYENKWEKKWLLFQGCSWTGSLLVSKAYRLLITAPEILKLWSHQYSCEQITGEFVYSREDQYLVASAVFRNTRRFWSHKTLLCLSGAQTPQFLVQVLHNPSCFLCFIHSVESPSFRYNLKATWKDRAWVESSGTPNTKFSK